MGAWIIVQVYDLGYIFNWRLQAEKAMIERCGEGMTDDEVAEFVSRYIPAYKAYLPSLYKGLPPGCRDASKVLSLPSTGPATQSKRPKRSRSPREWHEKERVRGRE